MIKIERIDGFDDFCRGLKFAGFSMGGGNDEGIFSLAAYYGDGIVEHTGISNTDPWDWRMRGISEYKDFAYSKVFFKKGGWVTKEWYPYFYLLRRKGFTMDELYEGGQVSQIEKEVYGLIQNNPHIALHEIKSDLGIDKSNKSQLDRAITNLQMGFFITISGQKYKISSKGEPYGWPVTTFCLVEDFWDEEVFEKASRLKADEAFICIEDQVKKLNPNYNPRKLKKFILG